MPRVVACDFNTINRSAPCFGCFSELENQAAIVYFLEQTRAKLANQTPLTANQLISAAACLSCVSADPTADNFDSAVAQSGAIAVGVTGASIQNIAQVRKAIHPLASYALSPLRRIEIMLRCQLNAFLGTA